MSTVYDPIRDNGKQRLGIFGNGLDESDVLLFINSLIEQNSELMGKLEEVNSLIKLAEGGALEAARQLESARAEADRIVAEARLIAEKTTHEQVSSAEEQAQAMLNAAREKAESILRSAEDEVSRIIFEAKQEIKAAGSRGNQPARMSPKESTDEEDSCALYSGSVELEIPPPLAMGPLTNLAKYLKNTSQIEVLALNSTSNRGLRIKLFLHNPLPLVNILKSMPQVEKVSGEFRKNQGAQSSRNQSGNGSILVKMRN